ncbi:MAG: hypothetical protein CM15mV92_040 [Caudoviricetes sp.]|nr:MAG: hypothetical protein CM15mV92_040 [Caudoviricetes sp.]
MFYDKKIKKITKNKQEVKHNLDLGNNYYPSGWKPSSNLTTTQIGELTHVQPQSDNFKFNEL